MPSKEVVRIGMLCEFRTSSQHHCKCLVSTALTSLQHDSQHLAIIMLLSTLHVFIAQQSGVVTDWFVNFIGNMQRNA